MMEVSGCPKYIKLGLNFGGGVNIKHYCFDDRINWNTWIVTDAVGVLGFTNGTVEDSLF